MSNEEFWNRVSQILAGVHSAGDATSAIEEIKRLKRPDLDEDESVELGDVFRMLSHQTRSK